MKISIGNDHAGPDYKIAIVNYLQSKGHEILNHGTDTFDSVDYPDFGHPVATDVESGKADLGIVICGSGNGIAMTANKHQGIRAALCWTKEISALARQHNNANVLSMGARVVGDGLAEEILSIFLSTPFEAGRHERRVAQLAEIEQQEASN